jgi:hypothetical protein
MDRAVFERFASVAELNAITFESEPYDGDESLLVVEVDRRFLSSTDDE